MNQRWLLALASILAGCGGNVGAPASQSASPEPAAAAEAVVQEFLGAVADSNLSRMAELWGTDKGSAARTKEPADYARRVVIMQAYLRDAPYRIMSNSQDVANPARRVLQVEFRRRGCEKLVPFVLVRAVRDGWLVNSVDLERLGSPGATCDERENR